MGRAPGRPKKQRRKANDEPKKPYDFAFGKQALIKRNQVTVRFIRCGVLGHNQRTCYGKQAADRTIPVGETRYIFFILYASDTCCLV